LFPFLDCGELDYYGTFSIQKFVDPIKFFRPADHLPYFGYIATKQFKTLANLCVSSASTPPQIRPSTNRISTIKRTNPIPPLG